MVSTRYCLGLAFLLHAGNAAAVAVSARASGWSFLGCYTDSVSARSLPYTASVSGGSGAMTIELCQSTCLAAGYVLAGVEYADECYCGNALQNGGAPAPGGTAGCNMACAGNSGESCGGGNRLDLYSYSTTSSTPPSGWTVLGCYTDSVSARSLPYTASVPGGSGVTTVELCESTCLAAGYKLAGVEYADECYCGNALQNGGGPAPDGTAGCNMACAGKSSETCGGGNRLDLYSYSSTSSTSLPASIYVSEATAAINQLQQSYNWATGLYDNLWWNTPNAITMLADLQEYFPSAVSSITSGVFLNTLSQAPVFNGNNGFLNGYYDDELWWALAWIKVYDVTNDVNYLNAASTIFDDAKAAWGTSPCGGLWWDKNHDSDNAIENSLYFSTAAKLANRKPSDPYPGYYFNEAVKSYNWIVNSGLINSQNLINDGLYPQSSNANSCKNNGGPTWSYNQGALLGGLAEMTWSTGDSKYNDLAVRIATAAVNSLTDSNGILHDPCESSLCGGDGGQFKGVFARNVQFLVNRANLPTSTAALFRTFLQENANSIWNNARSGNSLGPIWSGPYYDATVQDQSSALDAIVGAACVS